MTSPGDSTPQLTPADAEIAALRRRVAQLERAERVRRSVVRVCVKCGQWKTIFRNDRVERCGGCNKPQGACTCGPVHVGSLR